MLQRVVTRVRQSQVDDVIVATTFKDAEITQFCHEHDIDVYQGPERDILGRINIASAGYDSILRVWGDSPLVDPWLIDSLIAWHKESPDKYSYTKWFPEGVNVSVISTRKLGDYDREITNTQDREWIHKYLMTMENTFVLKNFKDLSAVNLSVNTQDDLDFMNRVYEKWENPTWQQALEMLKK